MIYILEGVDGAGKSTLAKALSKDLKLEVVKGSSFEQSLTDEGSLYNNFLEIAQMNNVIIDRYMYSNLVYAALYEGYSMISKDEMFDIENRIRHKTILFYLYASEEEIKKRLNNRGDDYVKTDMISPIINRYNEVLSWSNLSTVKINTTRKTVDEVLNLVKLLGIRGR